MPAVPVIYSSPERSVGRLCVFLPEWYAPRAEAGGTSMCVQLLLTVGSDLRWNMCSFFFLLTLNLSVRVQHITETGCIAG